MADLWEALAPGRHVAVLREAVAQARFLAASNTERALRGAERTSAGAAANAPVAVQLTMVAIERGLEMPQEQGLFLEASLFGMSCATEDMREGTRAFLEKRPAQFQGK